MLKVKSFSIKDDAGINELLTTNRLAPGANILVSDGYVCIPYEDGAPATKEQQIVALREQQNTIRAELAIIQHSQAVVKALMADEQDRLNFAEAEWRKATNNKELEKTYQTLKGAYENWESQYRQNAAEIVRLNINLDKFNDQINELNG